VLGIIIRSGRRAAVPTIDRIIDHESAAVRAAALAARSVLATDAEPLRLRLARENSAEVRGAIVANLVVAGALDESEAARELDHLLTNATPGTKLALAEAIGRRSAPGFDHVLVRLLAADELEVRRAAVVAMGHVPSPALLPTLVDALAQEATRHDAELALAAHAGEAFEVLRARFEDTENDVGFRWRIPQAMALCSPDQALAALVAWLPKEPDGGVRFGILLVLERLMRQHPTLPLDRAALKRSVHETITRAYRYLDARLLLLRGAVEEAKRKTRGHVLLHDLLRDKEANARGRLFRLLGLLHPTEDFGQIYRSLSVSKDLRVTSMELVESILREPTRSAVLGLIDDCADEQRLARAGRFHRPLRLGYVALLTQLFDGESDAVRQVARFHAGELGLVTATGQAGRAA
jgi:HEAT repeat protein